MTTARTSWWSLVARSREGIGLAIALAWIIGLMLIVAQAHTVGAMTGPVLIWTALLALIAWPWLRTLFGPVFFYDLLRVSRNRLTFGLRILYVVALGLFLLLMYYDWIYTRSRFNPVIYAQLMGFLGLVLISLVTAVLLAGQRIQRLLQVIVAFLGTVLAIVFFAQAWENWNPQYGEIPETLDSSVVARFASDFFESFVVVQAIVVALLTPVYVAGTIAVEKERKTLEFLLATDLRNREIIFGKLAARVLTLVMYVLAGLPLIAFLQLFGGIDPEQLLAACIGSVVTIFGLSALSLWMSTALRRARDAIILTYLLAIAYGFTSFLLAALAVFGGTGWWSQTVLVEFTDGLASGNPAWMLMRLGNGMPLAEVVSRYVIFWCIAGSLLLGHAIWRLRWITIQQAYGPVRAERKARKSTGESKPLRGGFSLFRLFDGSRERPAIESNPVTWKEVFVDSTFRSGCVGQIVGFVILALLFVPLGIILWNELFEPVLFRDRSLERLRREVNGWVRVVTGVLSFLMLVAVAVRGAGAFSGEKDRDTWISLISTPMAAEEILWGKWWGCVLSLRRAVVILLIVWGIGLLFGALNPAMLLVLIPYLVLYVSAFSWVGLYCSMTARNTLVASVRGFFAAIFCAGGFWIVLAVACFLPLSLGRSSNYRTSEQMSSFFCGFTPPLVMGVFPLQNSYRDYDLGPFRLDSTYSAGLTGPVMGFFGWLAFNTLMQTLCMSKVRDITNQAPRSRGQPDSLEKPDRTPEPEA